jgi:TatD DNase family protein
MKLVDVHAHLEHPRFERDLDEVVDRFVEGGGELIVSSGVNPETNRKALELARRYDVVRISFGLYPIDALAKEVESSNDFLREVKEFDVDEELAWIEEHADDCVAIGEVGLDYNWKEFQSDEMRERQKEVFRKVLRLAKKIGKPVVIHSRKAEMDVVEILEEEGMKVARNSTIDGSSVDLDLRDGVPISRSRLPSRSVVMHCFNGKKSLIKRGVENGWSFSVPANIVRLEHFKMLVEMVPLGQLLTETDAPYLSPVAGERNESVNVLVTLKEIAKIKGISVEEVAEKVWGNAERLFSI